MATEFTISNFKKYVDPNTGANHISAIIYDGPKELGRVRLDNFLQPGISDEDVKDALVVRGRELEAEQNRRQNAVDGAQQAEQAITLAPVFTIDKGRVTAAQKAAQQAQAARQTTPAPNPTPPSTGGGSTTG